MKRLRILSGILLILLGRAVGVIVFEVLRVTTEPFLAPWRRPCAQHLSCCHGEAQSRVLDSVYFNQEGCCGQALGVSSAEGY